MGAVDDEDARIRRDIELIVSGRMMADAGDKKEIEAYIQRLEQRRETILESGPWRIFKGSELADIQFQLGRASVGYEVVREQDAVLVSRQASEERRYVRPERDISGQESRNQREWWDTPVQPQAAVTEGQLPAREPEPEPDIIRPDMAPVERQVAQARLLEREKPQEWWDDGKGSGQDDRHDAEQGRERDRH